MAWEQDAPGGVYRDHALSSKVRREVVERLRVAPFLTQESGYGKGRGQSVTVTRLEQLPVVGSPIGELNSIPTATPAKSTMQVQVNEYGQAIQTTRYEEDITHFELNSQHRRMLRDHMMRTIDVRAAAAIKSTQRKFVQTGASVGTLETGTTFSNTAAANASVAHLRQLYDELSGTMKCPTFSDGYYVIIASTLWCRGIKNDPEFRNWVSPTSREPFIEGELPNTIEGFRIIETNHFDALANDVASGVTGEAVAFGEDAGFMATVVEPELIAQPDTEDFGRFKKIAWYGTFETGSAWADKPAIGRAIYCGSA